MIPNPEIRAKVERQINTDEVAEPNVFSCVASTAAMNEGRTWLTKMNEYVFANRDYAMKYIEENIPQLKPVHGDATYLLWVNCREICADSKQFLSFLREKTGLFISSGEVYGKGGEGSAGTDFSSIAVAAGDLGGKGQSDYCGKQIHKD